MNRNKTLLSILGGLVAIIVLNACGPSQTELDATATQAAAELFAKQTAEAPTATPTPTSTPIPTNTPTATPIPTNTPTATPVPTNTPTATPTPRPDPNAMLDWKSLELPSTFSSRPPDDMGIENGAEAFSVNLADGTPKTYTIENGFVFIDEERSEYVYGYTVLFRTKTDKDVFDWTVRELSNIMPLSEIEKLSIVPIGDSSGGVTGIIKAGQLMDHVKFREGQIGAYVFIRYPDGTSPSVTASHLAQVYAQSIADPTPKCSLVSITPVEGATWPSYDFVAEGFYPGEQRGVLLESESLVTGLLGQTGETADSEGRIEGNVTFGEIAGFDAELPSELSFSIIGWYSGCEVNQIVPWTSE